MRIAKRLTPLFLIPLLLAGCTSTAAAPPVAPSASPAITETKEPEPVFVTAPLTGVQYLEGTNPSLSLPAISAKIDNTSSGRPQLALNDADVIYVTRIEGGMTRLVPIWHSRVPDSIGPVRSVRPLDADIVDAYDGVFVFSGGQLPFKNAAKATGLWQSDEDTEMNNDTYYREKTRPAPWNLYFRASKLQQTHTEQPAPKATFEFSAVPSAVSLGVKALAIDVKYPGLRSGYLPTSSTFPWGVSMEPAWARSMDGTPLLQADGAQVITKNVVVLETVHDNSFIDRKYGAIPRAKIISNSGIAHVFSDGFYIKANWSKKLSSDPIVLTLDSGQVLKLAVGNTWIEMMDTSKSKLTVTYPEAVPAETTG